MSEQYEIFSFTFGIYSKKFTIEYAEEEMIFYSNTLLYLGHEEKLKKKTKQKGGDGSFSILNVTRK